MYVKNVYNNLYKQMSHKDVGEFACLFLHVNFINIFNK